MSDIILVAIKDMGSPFAACVLFICGSFTIIVCVMRFARADEAARMAKEQVRSAELNQINASLANMRLEKDHKITFLEGQLAGQGRDRHDEPDVSQNAVFRP